MSNKGICTPIGSVTIFVNGSLPGTLHVHADFACEQVPGSNDPCPFALLVTVDKWTNGQWVPIDAGQFEASGSNCQGQTVQCGSFSNMDLIESNWHTDIGPGTFLITATLYSGACAHPGEVLASQIKITSFV